MELFVFVRMGGKRIVIELLAEGGADLSTRLAYFDAGKAQCFLDGDKQKLWAVIEASFGTFEPFNKIVRSLMTDRLSSTDIRPSMASSRANETDTTLSSTQELEA